MFWLLFDHSFLLGMRLGRVRVIFSLPKNKLDKIFPINITPPAHLAYVEWFSKFTSNPEPYSGLYKVKKESIDENSRNVSVVPVEMIKHGVHLYPKWGGSVPPEWTSEKVIDNCSWFFLNPFKDVHMYFNMC